MQDIALERFSGFADLYDMSRPTPPVTICEMISSLLNKDRIDTVVDLGCGSGLSTKIWQGYAETIIGIEPNSDMRDEAIKHIHGIEFIHGHSYQTGMKAKSIDVVVCSQSFHWMEPVETLQEINRILNSTGLFAVLDCDWPVTISKHAEIAYHALFTTVHRLHKKYVDTLPIERKWPKEKHLENIQNSGYFHYCKEVFFDQCEICDAERFINIAMSQGHLQTLVKNGIEEIHDEIAKFNEVVRNDIPGRKKMYVSYRGVIGMK